MISAREDIAIGTKESITEWGFIVRIVYKSSGDILDVVGNGRKTSQQMSSDGLPIISNRPYVAIAKEDLAIIPVKGDLVTAPIDFFRPVEGETKLYRVENVSITDEDWFVKVYLTNAQQKDAE